MSLLLAYPSRWTVPLSIMAENNFLVLELLRKGLLSRQILLFMMQTKKSMLWIPIGFNADPDPAFEVNAESDPDPIPDPVIWWP